MDGIEFDIKYKANPIRLIFYAILFSLLLFLLLPLSRLFQSFDEQKDIIRSIELATLPPPPPRQQTTEEVIEQNDIISIQSSETEIQIEPLDIMLQPNIEGELRIQIDVGSFAIKQGTENLLADIEMFSLTELDTTPMSLNDPLFRVPSDLAEQGVAEINAEVLVILTEEGLVEFLQFISLSHQKASGAVRDYITRLRYTAPTKDGEAGRVRFRLPLRLQTGLEGNDQ